MAHCEKADGYRCSTVGSSLRGGFLVRSPSPRAFSMKTYPWPLV